MRIAIIGSGIAGLASAWWLDGEHEVTLFEANDYLGGHTHTHDVQVDGLQMAVDTGFIVSRHLDDKAGVATMLAALECLVREERTPTVDTWWLFTIAEEVGLGASSVLIPDVAATAAPVHRIAAPG